MNIPKFLLSIPEIDKTPLMNQCADIITRLNAENQILKEENQHLKETNQHLKDEIARLKGLKTKPKIEPSKLDKEKDSKESSDEGNPNPSKRPGSEKRSKTRDLKIDQEIRITPENLPDGSKLKDIQDYVVQEIQTQTCHIRYRLERWVTPTGETRTGQLPDEIKGSHFGPNLKRFILYQYYQCHVTQPLLLEQLLEMGVDISSGQINRILTENQDQFHTEKEEILRVGLEVSSHINVDDTGSRHDGENGFCLFIGNENFSYFESTDSKSRINFLNILRAGHTDYILNAVAFEYMQCQKTPANIMGLLLLRAGDVFPDETTWLSFLHEIGATSDRLIRIAAEGGMIGSIMVTEPAEVLNTDSTPIW